MASTPSSHVSSTSHDTSCVSLCGLASTAHKICHLRHHPPTNPIHHIPAPRPWQTNSGRKIPYWCERKLRMSAKITKCARAARTHRDRQERDRQATVVCVDKWCAWTRYTQTLPMMVPSSRQISAPSRAGAPFGTRPVRTLRTVLGPATSAKIFSEPGKGAAPASRLDLPTVHDSPADEGVVVSSMS